MRVKDQQQQIAVFYGNKLLTSTSTEEISY